MALSRRAITRALRILAVGAALAGGGLFLEGQHRAHLQAQAREQEAERLAAARAQAARIEAAWQVRLATARRLAGQVVLDGGTLHCTLRRPGDGPLRSSGQADADLLMAVSEQPLVVFLTPGFDYASEGGWQTFDYIRERFADEIAAAEAVAGGDAVCLVRWGTQAGFGDDSNYLAPAIAAVRALSEDPSLVTVGRAPSTPPRIVVIGYSAGGNFAKFAITHLAADDGATQVRLVTLGTPHQGTELARTAPTLGRVVAGVFEFFASLANDHETEKGAASLNRQLARLQDQPGVLQMQPDNPDLMNLNASMLRLGPTLHHLNIYSSADEFVPVASASWPGAIQADLGDVRHENLPLAPPGSRLRRLLDLAFSAEPMTQAAADQAVGQASTPEPTSPDPVDSAR